MTRTAATAATAAAVLAVALALAACEVDVPLTYRSDGPLPTDAGFVDAPGIIPDATELDAPLDAAASIDAALD